MSVATNHTITLVKDFKPTPIGKTDGAAFRKKFLVEPLKNGDKIVIDLNGNQFSYGLSFLREAFGGLVRENHISYGDFKRIFTIRHDLKFYRDLVDGYVEQAEQQQELANTSITKAPKKKLPELKKTSTQNSARAASV